MMSEKFNKELKEISDTYESCKDAIHRAVSAYPTERETEALADALSLLSELRNIAAINLQTIHGLHNGIN